MRPPVERKMHSPLPWFIGPTRKSDISNAQGRIAKCHAMRGQQGEVDAAFIVEAVTASASLVEQRDALREALTQCVRAIKYTSGVSFDFAVKEAEAALALVAERT